MTPDGPGQDDLMQRHRDRRLVNWTPFSQRRSEGELVYKDTGEIVTCEMHVAGLGVIVFVAKARYSDILQSYRVDQESEMTARLRSFRRE